MRIVKQEVLSRKGNPYFVYKYENGKFANKQLFEAQENMEPKKKKHKRKSKIQDSFPELAPVIDEVQLNAQFVETINTIEDNIANLDKQEEWQGEAGLFGIEVKTEKGSKSVSFNEIYQKEVVNFENAINEEIEKPVIGLTINEEKLPDTHVAPKVEKTPGFFTTWLRKWIW